VFVLCFNLLSLTITASSCLAKMEVGIYSHSLDGHQHSVIYILPPRDRMIMKMNLLAPIRDLQLHVVSEPKWRPGIFHTYKAFILK